MRYLSGDEVHEGDVVRIEDAGAGDLGTVIEVLVPGSAESVASGQPQGGVFIRSAGLGLSLTVDLERDPEVTLVARRA